MRKLATIIYSVLMIIFVTFGYAISTNKISFARTLSSSVSGKVLHDKNKDGFLDSGDSGFKNIQVSILGTSVGGGNIALSTTTDANGNYSFNGLVAGTYKVSVVLPVGSTGLSFSPKKVTGDDTTDFDVDASGNTDDIVIDGTNSVGNVSSGIIDSTVPKISFVHPLLKNSKLGDTIVLNCDNATQFDANSVTSSDNSTELPTVQFIDNAVKKGNCLTDGFHSLLYCEWVSTDGAGNQNVLYLFMKVVDNNPPVISNVPSDVTIDYSLGQTASLPNGVSALDQCHGNVAVQFSADTTFTNCVKQINRVWSATDPCGNIAKKSQLVTVINSGSQNLHISGVKTKNPNCNIPDGSILIVAQGTNLMYSINNGDSFHTSNSFNGLSAGNYSVVVKDGNGCKDFNSVSLKTLKCPDTLRLITLNGTTFDTCLTSMVGSNTLGSIKNCSSSSNDVTASMNNKCVTFTSKVGFVGTQNFCINQCNPNDPFDCSDIVIIVDVLPQRTVCQNSIVSDSTINIFIGDCASKATYCFNSNSVNFIRNFSASINGVLQDSLNLQGCNYDSLCYYYYSTIPGQGGSGPYRLDYWYVNGTAYRMSRFNNINTLVDSMNIWDPTGLWVIDPATFTIVKTGRNSNVYGDMKVTKLSNRVEGFLTLDCQAIPYGMKLCFFKGLNTVVFTDKNLGCTDTVKVTVTCPVQLPPVTIDDYYTTVKNKTISFNVTNNDTLSGNLVPVYIVKAPTHGNIGFPGGPNGTLIYEPNLDYCGNDTFCYGICNQYGCDTACVYITVNPDLSKLPIAVVDGVKTPKNTPINIPVLNNDTINGSLKSITIITQGTKGNVTVTGNNMNYNPNTDACGLDSFIYQICNANGCDTAKVFVDIECPVCALPIATFDVVSTTKNVSKVTDILANDFSACNIDTVKIIKQGRKGIGAITLQRKLNYLPRRDSCGLDTLIYEICNASGCDTAIVYVEIVCPPALFPVAVNDSVSTLKNTPVLIKVLDNDNPNTTTKSVKVLSGPSHGTLVLNPSNQYVYTPDSGFCALDTFYYILCNTDNLCDTARVIINVLTPIQRVPPVANNDKFTTSKNSSLVMNVLNNDQINGTILGAIRIISGPKHGGASVNNQNNISYIPANDYCGVDTLSYELCNTDGCDTAIVCIVVNCPAPKNPIAVDDFVKVNKDSTVILNVCNNDTLNGIIYPIAILTGGGPRHGSVGFPGVDSCTLSYKPNLGYCGLDTFYYLICSNPGLVCDTGAVYITVDCPATCTIPVANNDSSLVARNTPKSINIIGNDVTNCPLDSVVIIKNGSKGVGSIVLQNGLSYNPFRDTCGLDTITYKICNAAGCDTAFVFINIPCDSCSAPIANNDTASTTQDDAVMINVLSNDVTTCPIDSLTFTRNPSKGGVIKTTGNGVIYTPNTGFCGKDTFEYKICNAKGCDTATVFVNIACDTVKKFPPIAVDDRDTVLQNKDITINILDNDTINGVRTCLNIIENPKNGIATVTSQGQIFYAPSKDFCGKDSLRYELCNADGKDTAWVRIFVRCEKLKIHNAMSPNDDFKNDHFIITGIEDFPDNKVIIWDRWGLKVFETMGYNNGNNKFDGTWNGKNLPDGTYFYCVDDGKGQLFSGYLQLLR